MTDIEIYRDRILVPGPSGTVVAGDAITDLQTRVAELERVFNSQVESVVSTRWYGPLSTLDGYPAVTGTTMNANEFFASPVYIPHPGTFNVAGIEIITPAASGGAMRLGIYSVSPTNGLPTTLIQDFGTIDTTVAGFRSVPISITLQRGSYWLAGVANAAVTVARVPAQAGVSATMGHLDTSGNAPRSGLKRTTNLTTGFTSLPTSFGTAASITSILVFWLQAA